MANRKKVAIAIAVAILGLLAVVYMMKGNMGSEKSGLPGSIAGEHDAFGILELEKVFKIHPQYQKLEQLKKERNAIALNLENEKSVRLDTALPTIDLAALDDSIRQKKNEKIGQKLNALNEQLQQQEQLLRQQHSGAYEQSAKEIDEQYLPKIFNLQLKLETLSISQEAGMQIKQQIDGLKAEHEQKIDQQRQMFFAQVGSLMKDEHAKAKKELDEYAAAVEKELVADARKQVDEQQARNHLAMAGKSNEIKLGMEEAGKTREDLANKEKEIAVLQESMVKDIANKVAKVAEANKLSVVLTAVQVNVSAMEITDLVIKEFNN